MQHDKKDVVLDLFPEGIDSMAPLHEFPDIQNESDLKFNQNKTVKLLNHKEGSSKHVNSTEKK